MNVFLSILAIYLTFLIVDGLWIGLVVKKLYNKHLGELMREKPQPLPGLIFYLIYPLAIWIYAVMMMAVFAADTITFNGIAATFVFAFGFGLVAYATYALTSWSVFKQWSAKVAIPDILWGAFASGVAGMVGFIVYTNLA